MNVKITHIVKDGEVIIVFKRDMEKFGMRYEKINHLTYDDNLVWVNSNIFERKELGWLKTALDSIREEREKWRKSYGYFQLNNTVEEEMERRRQQEKKFIQR